MSRDVIMVGLTMRIPLLYRVSLAGTAQNASPTLKDPKFWTAKEKKTRKIDRLARSLLIQGLPNDIYPLIDSNETAKDLWDALERKMRGSEYGEQDMKAAILYEYETFKATEGEQLLDTYLRYLQVINDLMKCGYKKDNYPLALVAKKTKVSKHKEKVEIQSEYEGSDDEDISDLKKITALLAKAFNQKKYYAKPTNNNLRTSSASSSANKKPKYEGHFAKDCKKAKVKDYNYYKTKMLLAKKDSDEQVLLAKDQAWMESSSDSDQEINSNMVFKAKMEKVLSDLEKSFSSAKEIIAEKEGHFAKDYKKAKVKDYNYYKTKMLLAKKDNDEQVLLVEDQAWMESRSDSNQEINTNMVFMAQIDKVLSDSEASSTSADDKIFEVSYYLSDSESESEYETSDYYDNTITYGLFVNDNDYQEIFHDCENFPENLIQSQINHNESAVNHNDSEEINKLIRNLTK
nr:hypothetical protein [Tanacetum cinerariifolium]